MNATVPIPSGQLSDRATSTAESRPPNPPSDQLRTGAGQANLVKANASGNLEHKPETQPKGALQESPKPELQSYQAAAKEDSKQTHAVSAQPLEHKTASSTPASNEPHSEHFKRLPTKGIPDFPQTVEQLFMSERLAERKQIEAQRMEDARERAEQAKADRALAENMRTNEQDKRGRAKARQGIQREKSTKLAPIPVNLPPTAQWAPSGPVQSGVMSVAPQTPMSPKGKHQQPQQFQAGQIQAQQAVNSPDNAPVSQTLTPGSSHTTPQASPERNAQAHVSPQIPASLQPSQPPQVSQPVHIQPPPPHTQPPQLPPGQFDQFPYLGLPGIQFNPLFPQLQQNWFNQGLPLHMLQNFYAGVPTPGMPGQTPGSTPQSTGPLHVASSPQPPQQSQPQQGQHESPQQQPSLQPPPPPPPQQQPGVPQMYPGFPFPGLAGNGLPGIPNATGLPNMPDIQSLQHLAGLQSIPNLPSMPPGMPVPGIGSIPGDVNTQNAALNMFPGMMYLPPFPGHNAAPSGQPGAPISHSANQPQGQSTQQAQAREVPSSGDQIGATNRQQAIEAFQQYRQKREAKNAEPSSAPAATSTHSQSPVKNQGHEEAFNRASQNAQMPVLAPDQNTNEATKDQRLWPPGMLPPPNIMPKGDMPPPPPSFTNPLRIADMERKVEREKHDQEAMKQRRQAYAPNTNPKPAKLPRSKRYWLDQQAQLVANLESRGFVAIFRETPEYARYFCSLCNKDFETKLLCIRHAVEHLNFKPFRCTDCDMEFTRCDTLQRHLKGRCLGPESQIVVPYDPLTERRKAEEQQQDGLVRVNNKRNRLRIDKTRADSYKEDGTPIVPPGKVVSVQPWHTPEGFTWKRSSPDDATPKRQASESSPETDGEVEEEDQGDDDDDAMNNAKKVKVEPEDSDSSSDEDEASSSRILTGSKFLRPGPAPVVMPARHK